MAIWDGMVIGNVRPRLLPEFLGCGLVILPWKCQWGLPELSSWGFGLFQECSFEGLGLSRNVLFGVLELFRGAFFGVLELSRCVGFWRAASPWVVWE